MTVGQTIIVVTEIDFTSPYIQKDLSITAWATSDAITIKEATGLPSASYYLANL